MAEELDPYYRVVGAYVAHQADATGVPRYLMGMEPWWMPDPNPMPRISLFGRHKR